MSYREVYETWCTDPFFDENTRTEIRAICDEKEIEDRFYKELQFGTGGLRGIIGAGTNRMNIYTVGKATQGLAEYILSRNGAERGVVIAYDSRHFSQEFSLAAASCLAANGIKVYRFSSLRPTPELSFAVRKLHCMAGIVITASHNPAEYNGYKVYWEDGAQITSPIDREIMGYVSRVADYKEIKCIDLETAKKEGKYQEIGREIDEAYQEELVKLVLHPECIKAMADQLSIVYTPLHGTGLVPVKSLLQSLGLKKVHIVKEQEQPDGDFPTISYPNPEDPAAFALALTQAKERKADLVLATDPDADRLGVYVRDDQTGEYHAMNGNMTGVLLCEYLLSQRKAQGRLPKNGVVVKTIVTTNMVKEIARKYGVEVVEVLTGFKYIGEQIKQYEQEGNRTFLFGFEESYGCLTGTYARDKDAVGAVLALCEAAAYYKLNGISLWEKMKLLYAEYGNYQETLETVTLKGVEGSKKIREIMKKMRDNSPEIIDGRKVLKVRDYLKGTIKNLETGEIGRIALPKSDVLYFELEKEAWCCVRPSGTEPKIKYYRGCLAEQ